MPERFDPVIVATSRRQVELPWASRATLIERLRAFPSAAGIVDAFEIVDATRPIMLTAEDEAIVHEAAQEWENEVGADNLPPSILELRDALRNVLISYSRGEVEIEWDARNLLLDRIEGYPTAGEIVSTFRTIGASHPIRLTDEQMPVLLDAVALWLEEVGVTGLPPGIFKLRNALEDHMHDVQAHSNGAD